MISSGLFQGTKSFLNSMFNGVKTTQINLNQQIRNLGYIGRMMLKDIKRRETLRKFAPDRIKLKCLKSNSILPKPIKEIASEQLEMLPRDSVLGHVNDRCAITSRAGNCMSRWRVSRLIWRSLADYNQMSGVKRACWGVPTRNAKTFIYKRYRPTWFNTEGYSVQNVVQKNGSKGSVRFRFVD